MKTDLLIFVNLAYNIVKLFFLLYNLSLEIYYVFNTNHHL